MMRYFYLFLAVLLLSSCSSAGGDADGTAGPTATLFSFQSTVPVASITPVEALTPAATQPPPSAAVPASALPPTSAQPSPTPTVESTDTAAPPASATSLPDPAGYTWQPVAGGLSSPVSMAHAGDGSGRLFVIEQAGLIRIVQNNTVLPTPFLDISSEVNSDGNEQGLLGLAFHPRYTENGFFYVNYTRLDGDTVIARFQVSPGDPNAADPASETQLMNVAQPFANHNGGAVVFGPDGYLYLALGDGGSAGDPRGNGQSLDTLLGKILRIDVDAQGTDGKLYGIPADNPFANGGGLPEIWAYGLRNPWRIAFDRQTGDLMFADVGQNQWEEVNFLPAGSSGGANFGWDYFEGTHPFDGELPAGVAVIGPVAEYSHAEGGCSITGGFTYRGPTLPAFQGVYLYGDFCSGHVWGLLRGPDGAWQNARLFQNVGLITSFGEDEAGELYLLDRAGIVYKLSGI